MTNIDFDHSEFGGVQELDPTQMDQVCGGVFVAGVPGGPGASKPNKDNATAEAAWFILLFGGYSQFLSWLGEQ